MGFTMVLMLLKTSLISMRDGTSKIFDERRA